MGMGARADPDLGLWLTESQRQWELHWCMVPAVSFQAVGGQQPSVHTIGNPCLPSTSQLFLCCTPWTIITSQRLPGEN